MTVSKALTFDDQIIYVTGIRRTGHTIPGIGYVAL
jgi:hypothetical protein